MKPAMGHPSSFTAAFEHWLHERGLPYSLQNWEGFGRFQIGGKITLVCVDLAESTRFASLREQVEPQTIVLWEDFWVIKQEIVKSRILALLGHSVRIPARLTKVERIDKPTSDSFLENNHMNDSPAARYRFGLFLPARHYHRFPGLQGAHQGDRMLVAVATFAAPRTFSSGEQPYKSGELVRFASLQGTTVVGGLTKLVDHYAGQYHLSDVITYVDREWSEGTSFVKSGFELTGTTEPVAYVADTRNFQRYPLHRLDNKILKELEGHSVQLTNAGSLKFTRKYVPGKQVDKAPLPEIRILTRPPYDAIFIIGPTASGKTGLAVRVAYELGGEIISLDSRQVYRRMDIGTGKDLEEYQIDDTSIPHHLIDIAEPDTNYNVRAFESDFTAVYRHLRENRKPVIACGGSGLYIEAALNAVIKEHGDSPASLLIVAVNPPPDLRSRRIELRLQKRLKSGMIEEVRSLLEEGITPDKLLRFGLEYKFVTLYVLGKISYEAMYSQLFTEIRRFAKRQVTYLRHLEKKGFPLRWL